MAMTTRPAPVVRVEALRQMQRKIRRPKHTFHIKARPWEIAPFMIAPVLPGETLKNLLMQARVISDPITSQLIGWWCEHYFMYVRHRDIAHSALATTFNANMTEANITRMHLDPEFDLSSVAGNATALPQYYSHGDETVPDPVNWTGPALAAICEWYFRDEGETFADVGTTAFATAANGGLPIAKAVPHKENWMDSIQNAADFAAHDVEVTTSTESGAGDPHTHTVSMADIDQAMRTYEWLRAQNLVEMTFEQFLETHGVAVPAAEDFRPELIRYERSWTYPSNSVDPDAGSVRSVVSWSPTVRADKDRFFREPGFIIGCSVVRPKVYLANQRMAAAYAFSKAVDWLPAVLAGDAWASYRNYPTGGGPLPNQSDANGYWVDMKDLFLYGDQFINYDYAYGTDLDLSLLNIPVADGTNKRYASLTDARNLFVNNGAVGGEPQHIRQDGVVTLMVASRQSDQIRSTT